MQSLPKLIKARGGLRLTFRAPQTSHPHWKPILSEPRHMLASVCPPPPHSDCSSHVSIHQHSVEDWPTRHPPDRHPFFYWEGGDTIILISSARPHLHFRIHEVMLFLSEDLRGACIPVVGNAPVPTFEGTKIRELNRSVDEVEQLLGSIYQPT
jgi:hypothetical protein